MDRLRNLDLNLLVALEVLLDERNVTRAASRLGLTQSAMSGVLARLRAALDDPLFVRIQRGIQPTPRAEALGAPLKRWLEDGRTLVSGVAFEPGRFEGSFTISTTDYMQLALLLPFFARLRREAPGMRFAVVPLARRRLGEALASGEVDLAVTVPEFAPVDLPSQRLYRERYVTAMRRVHPLARRARLSLDDFARCDHVLVSPTGGSFEGPTDLALAALGRRRRVRLSVPSFLLVPELLRMTDLLAVIPARALHRKDDLVTRKPPLDVPDFDVIAVWHPRVAADPPHAWVRDRLAETARTLPGPKVRAA
jgi:DNA-binding transcriptional LysR family regulator